MALAVSGRLFSCVDRWWAPDVDIDGHPTPIREALNLIGAQLGVDPSHERLLIASTGEIALPHEPAQ